MSETQPTSDPICQWCGNEYDVDSCARCRPPRQMTQPTSERQGEVADEPCAACRYSRFSHSGETLRCPVSKTARTTFTRETAPDTARQRDELLSALGGLVRIIEAMRFSTGLGANQMARLEKAKELIASAGKGDR